LGCPDLDTWAATILFPPGAKTIDLTLYLASDLGTERESQRYQDMLKRVEIILDYNRRE
jgi:hypothetical protein